MKTIVYIKGYRVGLEEEYFLEELENLPRDKDKPTRCYEFKPIETKKRIYYFRIDTNNNLTKDLF